MPISSYDYPNGAYLRDLNNEYLPYVGTWKGVRDNKEYTFVFQIFTQHLFSYPNGEFHYQDVLKAKYEVKDLALDDVIFTTMSAVNYDDFWIAAINTTDSNGRIDFLFTDVEHCYNAMTFALFNVPGNANQLKYGVFNYTDCCVSPDCPYNDVLSIPVPISKKSFVLTKQ